MKLFKIQGILEKSLLVAFVYADNPKEAAGLIQLNKDLQIPPERIEELIKEVNPEKGVLFLASA